MSVHQKVRTKTSRMVLADATSKYRSLNKLVPSVDLAMSILAEHLLQNAIGAFGLAVGARMKRGRQNMVGFKATQVVGKDVRHKIGAMISTNFGRAGKWQHNFFVDEISNGFTSEN